MMMSYEGAHAKRSERRAAAVSVSEFPARLYEKLSWRARGNRLSNFFAASLSLSLSLYHLARSFAIS